jgi:FkbM family methyltransferase
MHGMETLRVCSRFIRAFGPRRGLPAFSAMHGAHSGTATVELPGLAAPLVVRRGTSDTDVFRQIFLERQYDAHDLQQWKLLEQRYRSILDQGKRPIVVDAGANVGFASVFFHQLFPSAQILAVEPERGNFSMLVRNTVAYPEITPLRAAVSDRGEAVRISNLGAESWAFRVEGADPSDPSSIRGITIDELRCLVPDGELLVVKVDIEGAEEQLFRQNLDWLAQTPLLVAELHDWMKPWSGSSRPLLRAVAALDCDVCFSGENVLVFNWDALGVPARTAVTGSPVAP